MSYRLHLRRAYLLLTSSQTTFVIDIDGTVADISHRQSLIEQDPPDWDTFFDPDLVMKDKPKKVKKILKDIIDKYGKIYFLTGRPYKLRKTTQEWLKRHFDLDSSDYRLFMRGNTDKRPSSLVKKTFIEKVFPDRNFVFVDDEDDNLEMMSEFGEALKAPGAWDKIEQEYL